MEKKFRLTFLSFLMIVFIWLTVSQPYDKLTHLKRLQQHLITVYEQHQQNLSTIDLDSYMDSQLSRRWHGIIDLIRGWALDAPEEELNVLESMNYMRSVLLYACVMYADSLYDSYSPASNIDAVVLFQASQIFRISANYEWTSQPSNQISRFELRQFHHLGIQIRAVNDTPYVQLYSTNTAFARFFHDILPLSEGGFLPAEMLDFTPLPRNPRVNLANELNMLMHAQRYLLILYNLSKSSFNRNTQLRNELFYMNSELQCFMLERFEIFFQQWNLTTVSHRNRNVGQSLMWMNVLQQCIPFAFRDYTRHTCHPAHINFVSTINANVIAELNENHVRLMHAYGELTANIEAMTANNVMLTALNSSISNLPLRVGYVRYDEMATLRIGLDCKNSSSN